MGGSTASGDEHTLTGYDDVRESAGYHRPDEGVVSVSGEDAVGFLDRTVTNEVEGIDEGDVVRSLYLDSEGKTRSDLRVLGVSMSPNRFLIVAPNPDEVAEEWDSNVFIDDVSVADSRLAPFTVQGPESEAVLRTVGVDAPTEGFARSEPEDVDADADELYVFESERTEFDGYDVLVPEDSAESFASALEDAGAAEYDDATSEVLRVEAGVPGFETELRGRVPLGAGLDDLLSFDKCYTGQEVVARVAQRSDGPSRRLVGFVLDAPDHPPEPGSVVRSNSSNVGVVTSAVVSPEHGSIALGYADDEVEMGDSVEVGEDDERLDARLASLPFEVEEGSNR